MPSSSKPGPYPGARTRPGRGTLLSRSPLLARVGVPDLTALVRKGRQQSFRARQVLFQRGDAADGLYTLVAGRVRVMIQQADGGELTLATFGPGEVLGELSVLDGTPRSATAVAISPVDALYITADHFRTWVDTHPDAAWQLLAGLAMRIRSTNEQVAEIALLSVQARIAKRLWQQFGEVASGEVRRGLKLRVNQVEWASTLGATRESINKQLARLKADGVIGREDGELVLLDPVALRDAAALT